MYYLMIAMRYLRGRKKYFLKSGNMVSLLGIIIGVFALLVVSSVMNGFDSDMRERILQAKGDIRVTRNDYSPIANYRKVLEKLSEVDPVTGSAPVIEAELMLQKKNNLAAAVCFGIDFNQQRQVSNILDRLIVGIPDSAGFAEDGLIIGLDLSLNLNATVGEYVQISSPLATEPSPFGLLPRTRKFKVIGIFLTGLPEYDKLYTYISLGNMQYFQGGGDEVDYLEFRTSEPYRARATARKISRILGPDFLAEDWSQFESNLFNAIRMEKTIMFVVLALMIIMASSNMIGNFLKLVTEKRAEIGILRALGAQDKDLARIFRGIGLLLGVIGTLTGTLFALILLGAQQHWHLIQIPVPGFPLHWVPVEIRLIDFIIIPLLVIIISILTTVRPIRKALAVDPIKIIRN